ncbi:MAG: DmsC/YnfH family molybdoenzyme membrane anchor subunit [Pseudomonadota bacterium]
MTPAPSVIVFTVLSGMGFGLLAFLGAGFVQPAGWAAFFHWGLGYALAVGGLSAATFHLGNPQRALRAFTQWQTSWLSREAWAAVLTLLLLAPVALSDWLGLGWPRISGLIGAVACFATVFTTSMIYAQIAAVPRWNNWTVPAMLLAFELTGGALLSGQGLPAVIGCIALILALYAHKTKGDVAFAKRGQTLGKATGLDRVGNATVFEHPHTSPNYLMREMIYVVARKHVARLWPIAFGLGAVVPALLVAALPAHPLTFALAALIHLIGALASRWLFFAQAEHVVGLYYGQRAV